VTYRTYRDLLKLSYYTLSVARVEAFDTRKVLY